MRASGSADVKSGSTPAMRDASNTSRSNRVPSSLTTAAAASGATPRLSDIAIEIAREEGYTRLAAAFELTARVEAEHEARYRSLIGHLEQGSLSKRAEKTVWICRYCGHIHEGEAAPMRCPLCGKAQGFFEVHSREV